jgi:tetratricopeptide (TPR) repeat protein
VWKDTFVEESNINYTISLLRKTLGENDIIQTVPRRGYRFAAEINDNSPNATVPIIKAVETPTKQTRWILIGAFVFSLAFLTSFIFWGTNKIQSNQRQAQSADSEAMQAYTRGKMILQSKSVEGREEKAIDEFQKAVAFDPAFALAYAGLAEGFSTTAIKLPNESGHDYYTKAKVAAEKALALDPNLPEGFLARGWLKLNSDWDFHGGYDDLRMAVSLAPDNAMAHYRLSRALVALGRIAEAVTEIDRAYEIDPVSEVVSVARFAIYEANGDYDKGLKLSEALVRENKGSSNAGRLLVTFLYHKGEFARIIELGKLESDKKGGRLNFAWISLLSAAYLRTGNLDKAGETLEQLKLMSLSDSKALYSLVMNYAELDRTDEAIAALQKCVDEHEERVIWARYEPRFANLRNDVRFKEILKQIYPN